MGIVGNECADKLAKAAVRLAFRAVTRSAAERVELEMDGMADAMVAAMTSDFLTRQQSQEPEPKTTRYNGSGGSPFTCDNDYGQIPRPMYSISTSIIYI